MLNSKYPFIETVSRALCEADGLDPDEEWQAYEELAMTAIKTIKEWFEKQKSS